MQKGFHTKHFASLLMNNAYEYVFLLIIDTYSIKYAMCTAIIHLTSSSFLSEIKEAGLAFSRTAIICLTT